jgi:hypothetical protein
LCTSSFDNAHDTAAALIFLLFLMFMLLLLFVVGVDTAFSMHVLP